MVFDLTILYTLAAFLQQQLKNELLAQQHNATGELIESINVFVQAIPKLVEIKGESIFYGPYIERGRPAKITRVPVDALQRWIEIMGFELDNHKDTKSLAFAIQHSIYEKGIPAKPYVQWSEGNSLDRTGWVDNVLTNAESRIVEDITRWVGDNITIFINNLAARYGSQQKTI